MRSVGLILLGLWLIAEGILNLIDLHFPYDRMILAAAALSAGVALLLNSIQSRLNDLGVLFLGLWLILRSSLFLFKFSFPYSEWLLAITGIIAGLLLILRK